MKSKFNRFGLALALGAFCLPACVPTGGSGGGGGTTPPAATYEISTWAPYTSKQSVQDSIKREKHSLDTVHVFRHVLAADGTFGPLEKADPNFVADLIADPNVDVVATLSDGGVAGLARSVLDSNRQRHLDAIVALIKSENYAGVDLNYVGMTAAERGIFSAFVEDLAQALDAEAKRLVVTVYAQTSAPGDWDGAQSHDYARIGAAADQVNIMCYDFGRPTTTPGPVGSLAWVTRVISHAVGLIPPGKIFLGLPLYGRDWESGKEGWSLTDRSAQDLIAQHGATPAYSATDAESTFGYSQGGKSHTVWFQTPEGLEAKLDLVDANGLGGAVTWRIGNDDPAAWNSIRKALNR